MNLPVDYWSNKRGTSNRSCSCGSWAQHWVNYSNRTWPPGCSVAGCFGRASVGGHVINSLASGEYIVPLCDSCNARSDTFSLSGGVFCVSANKSETCDS